MHQIASMKTQNPDADLRVLTNCPTGVRMSVNGVRAFRHLHLLEDQTVVNRRLEIRGQMPELLPPCGEMSLG
eukprot:7539558-Lingulodinium_polyedra.AAC.1